MLTRRRLPLAVFAALLGLLLHATFPSWSKIFDPAPAEFHPEAWKDTFKYRRQGMAEDLLARYSVVGMPGDAIVLLLGIPDSRTAHELHYFVAITSADYIALSFKLNADGRVMRAYLHQT